MWQKILDYGFGINADVKPQTIVHRFFGQGEDTCYRSRLTFPGIEAKVTLDEKEICGDKDISTPDLYITMSGSGARL